jgi:uncharacterized protein (TIGR03435 family)
MNSASLLNCIVWAYQIKDYQVLGPDWIQIDIYNIAAKTTDPTPFMNSGSNWNLRRPPLIS